MKILFVCSGNKNRGINVIVKNQGTSLIKKGINVEYYLIIGKGLLGYFINIFKLKKFLKKHSFDVVHAHYSLSGFVAAFSKKFPLVVSLMGSDAYSMFPFNKFIWLFHKFFWDATIVKCLTMKMHIGLNDCFIVPNGVDLERFKQISALTAKKNLNLNVNKKYILFLANPKRKEKNYSLAKLAFNMLSQNNVELLTVSDITNEMVPVYMNAVDVLLLTSKWEGSVNVIKEAMACNLPIVSTDVGDIKWVIGNIEGCYISSFDPKDVADKIMMALTFSKRTNGRNRIIELGLDSNTIAERLISIYEQVVKK
jgi:glycosyltransferase involved in cell wall biosynthesis